MESIKFLRISEEAPSLSNLPTDILYIIFSHLDTARSVAHLGATCKGLHHFVSERGWQIFVTQRFNTFTLAKISSTDEWRERARSLTSQSRDWDKRGFVVDALFPPPQQRTRHRFTRQSIPSNIIVDAHYRYEGNDAKDLIFWGAGEDVFGLVRHQKGPKAFTDEPFARKGELSGFRSGEDDVTCVSILRDSKYNYGQGDGPQVLVGRASGRLQLLSMGAEDFGNALLSFEDLHPQKSASLKTEIQSFDVNYKQGLLAAATKNCILNYSLDKDRQTIHNAANQDCDSTDYVCADDYYGLKDNKMDVGNFDYIRSVKFVNDNTLAVGLNRGSRALQYLKYTPTGIVSSHTIKTGVQNDIHGRRSHPETVRAILPVDTSSLTNGGGNSVLSSWNDGTVRLQDLRTPSSTDMIFQDNFEIMIPVNALLSRGLERFLAGSAHGSTLKVFDYRWPKRYYHTDSLPCGHDTPYPVPRDPLTVFGQPLSGYRATCDHVAGLSCRWHKLSRHDFYRPNFNMWLPTIKSGYSSSVYSLASPSDDSPTIFAGLLGIIAEITPKSSPWPATRSCTWPSKDTVHRRESELVALIETGSGFEVDETTDVRGVPEVYQQKLDVHLLGGGGVWRKRYRLDEWLRKQDRETYVT
ncbi:hypothetical protein F4805DRAFT_146906 [Annulohypoxylon moriforme]|nr:hypothetical protein F4805DRAFT_146906 [Annulohypoxylon moriforme]